MWSTLPSNLRSVLGAALVLGIGVAVAALTLSFFALRAAAEDPALKFGNGHAWLFPIGIDMALIFFEILLIGASMVRIQERGKMVPYPRAVPFLLMMTAAGATLYFNATRVPAPARPIALAVPVASVLVTFGLAYLLKMLARVSGADYIFEAPVEVDPRKLVRSSDVLDGQIVRTDVPSGIGAGTYPPQGAFGEMPSQAYTENSQNGHGGGVKKRQIVESYLARTGNANLTAREISADLAEEGTPVSERYIHDLLGGRSGPSRNGNGKS